MCHSPEPKIHWEPKKRLSDLSEVEATFQVLTSVLGLAGFPPTPPRPPLHMESGLGDGTFIDSGGKQVRVAAPFSRGQSSLKELGEASQSGAVDAGSTPYLGVKAAF